MIKTNNIHDVGTSLLETVLACWEGRATLKSLFKLEEKLYRQQFSNEDKNLEEALILIHEFKIDMTNGKISQELIRNYFNVIMDKLTANR